eukprot:61049-Pelagomonas_calceolata.AAC.4
MELASAQNPLIAAACDIIRDGTGLQLEAHYLLQCTCWDVGFCTSAHQRVPNLWAEICGRLRAAQYAAFQRMAQVTTLTTSSHMELCRL